MRYCLRCERPVHGAHCDLGCEDAPFDAFGDQGTPAPFGNQTWEDPLDAARGINRGCLAALALWAAIGFCWWLVARL